MIQKKKKQIKFIVLIAMIVLLLAGGCAWFIQNIANNKAQSGMQELSFKTKSLILKTDTKIDNTYGAVYTEEIMKNIYVFEYDTEENTKRAYENLKNNTDIEYVKPDTEYKINDISKKIISIQSGDKMIASWAGTAMGLDKLQISLSLKPQLETITVGLIDSGVDTTRQIFTEQFPNSIITPGYNAIDRSSDITDEDGHGTTMAAAILDGASENVKILPIKVLDSDGTGTGQNLIRGINYAIEQNVDVINISMGGISAGDSTIMEAAVQTAIDNGIIVVIAAGNGDENRVPYNMDLPTTKIYPASVENAITITALKNNLIQLSESGGITTITNEFADYARPSKNDLTVCDFANYGSVIDFAAPGEYLLDISSIGTTTGVVAGSGTSQATAYMSALVADVLSYNKTFTNDQVYQILQYYTEDLGDAGRDVHYGHGFVNFNNVNECTCNCTTCNKIYCFGCECSNCAYHTQSIKTLSKIDVTTPPTKIIYNEGENFDKTGMIITATYSDDSTDTVTNYTVIDGDSLTVGKTSVTISYTEGGVTKETTQAITVKSSGQSTERTLTKIEVTNPPLKTVYNEGEDFNKTGMVVTATYSDGTSNSVTTYTILDGTNLSVGRTNITISYTEGGITKETTQNITVKTSGQPIVKTLSKIEVTTPPEKIIYDEGESFNRTGMVVTAIYSDNTKSAVSNYIIVDGNNLSAGKTSVTISYTEGGITKETTQAITVKTSGQPIVKTLSKIEVTTPPTKTKYNEGENFDKTGMIVTAIYSDNSSNSVTNYIVLDGTNLSTGKTSVTISYTEGGVTKETVQTITVAAKQTQKNLIKIEVTTLPTKTTYTEGEMFDKAGMIIVAVYSDGSREYITNYNCFPVTALTTGNNKITISYTENGTTVTTIVPIVVTAKNNSNNQNNNNQNNNNNTGGNTNNNNTSNNTNNSGNVTNGVINNSSNLIIIKDDTSNSNVTDNTVKDSNLAFTGAETYIIPMCIIAIIGIVAFIKYRQYKDI